MVEVHDLHIWEVTSGYAALSAHILVNPGADCHAARLAAEQLVREAYGIEHTTLQVDHAHPDLLTIGDEHCADPHGPVHRQRRMSLAALLIYGLGADADVRLSGWAQWTGHRPHRLRRHPRAGAESGWWGGVLFLSIVLTVAAPSWS